MVVDNFFFKNNFFKFIIYFVRERDSVGGGGRRWEGRLGSRERQRERFPSRFLAASAEPYVGLESTKP